MRFFSAIFSTLQPTKKYFLDLESTLDFKFSEIKKEIDFVKEEQKVLKEEPINFKRSIEERKILNAAKANAEVSDITVQALFTDKDVPIIYPILDASFLAGIDTSNLRSNKTFVFSLSNKTIYIWDGEFWQVFITLPTPSGGKPMALCFSFNTLYNPQSFSLSSLEFAGTIIGASVVVNSSISLTTNQLTLSIGSTPITGLTNLSLTNSAVYYTATSANTFVGGETLTMTSNFGAPGAQNVLITVFYE